MELGYQTIEFINYSLMNPGGIVLQSALDFEQEGEQFIPLIELVGTKLNEARNELKRIQFLQDKYAAMQQGFYLEIEQPAAPEELPLPEMELNITKVAPVEPTPETPAV